jgi:hypothetical protein
MRCDTTENIKERLRRSWARLDVGELGDALAAAARISCRQKLIGGQEIQGGV